MNAGDTPERSHFVAWFRLAHRDRYLIWFSGSTDGVVVDGSARVPVFESPDLLRRFAAERGIPIADEPPLLHDLDAVEAWASSDLSTRPDCDACLSAWNLFVDVAHSTGHPFDADPTISAPLYDRLFYGTSTANELLRPEGEPVFDPRWTKLERLMLSSMLIDGSKMFRASLA